MICNHKIPVQVWAGAPTKTWRCNVDIRETNLQFKAQTRRRAATRRIVIHHSDSGDASAATIHQWHLDRGWHGIGYHFVIRHSGIIERGRAEETVGAHAGVSGNSDSIGICLTGQFDQERPRDIQMNVLAKFIVNYLYPKYGNNLLLEGHNDHASTSCPGRYFSFINLRKSIKDLQGGDQALPTPKVIINGQYINAPVKLERDRIYIQIQNQWVQLRALVNAIPNADVTWNQSELTAEVRIT